MHCGMPANTAKIFALSKNEAEFQRIMGPVIEAFKPVDR